LHGPGFADHRNGPSDLHRISATSLRSTEHGGSSGRTRAEPARGRGAPLSEPVIVRPGTAREKNGGRQATHGRPAGPPPDETVGHEDAPSPEDDLAERIVRWTPWVLVVATVALVALIIYAAAGLLDSDPRLPFLNLPAPAEAGPLRTLRLRPGVLTQRLAADGLFEHDPLAVGPPDTQGVVGPLGREITHRAHQIFVLGCRHAQPAPDMSPAIASSAFMPSLTATILVDATTGRQSRAPVAKPLDGPRPGVRSTAARPRPLKDVNG
jgi:hypothetical protein